MQNEPGECLRLCGRERIAGEPLKSRGGRMEAVRIASVATGDFLFAFRKLLLKERHHRPVEIAMEGGAGLLIALALLVIGVLSGGNGGRVLAVPHIGQQARQFLSDDSVAFAGRGFQPGPLDHGNVAAAVTDEPGTLQIPC